MTCGSAREALLDLARGVAMPESERLAVETHVSTCPACAADLERHRDLTAALQALSAEAQAWSASPEIEHRLQAAFEAERTASVPLSGSAPQTDRWVYALAMAAIVALAVWIGSRAPRPPAGPATAAAPSPAAAPARRPPLRVGTGSRGPASDGTADRQQAAETRGRKPRRPRGFDRSSSSRFRAPWDYPTSRAAASSGSRCQWRRYPDTASTSCRTCAKATVEADVLVGQDGQPRAIRLVTADEQSTRDVRSKP